MMPALKSEERRKGKSQQGLSGRLGRDRRGREKGKRRVAYSLVDPRRASEARPTLSENARLADSTDVEVSSIGSLVALRPRSTAGCEEGEGKGTKESVSFSLISRSPPLVFPSFRLPGTQGTRLMRTEKGEGTTVLTRTRLCYCLPECLYDPPSELLIVQPNAVWLLVFHSTPPACPPPCRTSPHYCLLLRTWRLVEWWWRRAREGEGRTHEGRLAEAACEQEDSGRKTFGARKLRTGLLRGWQPSLRVLKPGSLLGRTTS